jgi:signal transduction histidine kinase
MLTFSRKSDSVFSPQRIDKILDQTIDIVVKDFDLKKHVDYKKIKIIRTYDEHLPEIFCDRGKLQQVFFNILKNGAQAMAGNLKNREPVFRIAILRKDGSVVIEIEDNGPGMDETVKARIFEPFFTTKSVGLGTGLGLYISYFIIVENHKGTITVESVPGRGTNFIIRLPLHQVI